LEDKNMSFNFLHSFSGRNCFLLFIL
jgi:hypothetical protein